MATACADAERLCFEQPRMAKIVARPTGAWLLAEKISMYDATPPTRASAVGRTMKLDHVAIWAENIELLRALYEKRKRFTSYFLTFPGGGRLEPMHRPDIQKTLDSPSPREHLGYAHLGVELGSRAAVDALTRRLQGDGFPLLDGPRRTGVGYYESMVADPEGNRIVIAE